MTKVIKKNIDAFKNLKLEAKKAEKVKGGSSSADIIILEEILDN